MNGYNYIIKFINNKFPGFIGLTLDQLIAVKQRDYLNSGLSLDDYMSLIDPDYPAD